VKPSWIKFNGKQQAGPAFGCCLQGDIINGNVTDKQSHAEFVLITGIFEGLVSRGLQFLPACQPPFWPCLLEESDPC
jgi:hypothetical protein